MKYFFIFFLFCSFLTVQGQEIDTLTAYSNILNQKRHFLVYKPAGYETDFSNKWDVIYVFDAQNREIFDFVQSTLNFVSPETQFLVVGIMSPTEIAYDDHVYSRNHDMLTEAKDVKTKERYFGSFSNGNAANFKNYIVEEVVPIINKYYRTTSFKCVIGHSNSATFGAFCFLENSDVFDAYILNSPNFAYDKKQFVQRFEQFDFSTVEKNKFLFISNANESTQTGWNDWQGARQDVYKILQMKKMGQVHLEINKYPDAAHWNSFAESCLDGLNALINYRKAQTVDK